MGAKTVNFLKNENRDINNVLDSFLNNTDGGSLTGALHATNAINSIGNKKFMNFGASLAGINATAVTYGANDILTEAFMNFNSGGTVFGYRVEDPERYGVVEVPTTLSET